MNDIPDDDDGAIDPEALGIGAAAGAAAACLSCGARVSGRYCGECGQRDDDMRRSLPTLGRNFVEDTFAFDSRMWRTIGRLAVAPGRIPRDYSHGKRSAYTPPVRLFLWVSFVFFLVLGFTNTMFIALEVREQGKESNVGLIVAGEAAEEGVEENCNLGMELRFFVRPSEIKVDEAAWRRCAGEVSKAARESVEEGAQASESAASPAVEALDGFDRVMAGLSAAIAEPTRFNDEINEWLPRVMFFMTPLLALFLALFIRGKDALLFDHAVLAIYTHAVGFVVIGAAILLGQAGIGGVFPVALGTLFFYFLISLKTAYRRGWIKTAWTAFMVSLMYMLMLAIASLLVISLRIWNAGA